MLLLAFVLPRAVGKNILSIKGVDRHVVLHSAVTKDGVPVVKQNLILRKTKKSELSVSMLSYANPNGFRSTFRLTIGMLSLSALRTMLCRSCSLEDRKARKVPFIPMACAWVKHMKSAPRMPLMAPV